MTFELQPVWLKIEKPMKAGLLAIAGLTAFYISAVLLMRRASEIANQRATGLASLNAVPAPREFDNAKAANGSLGGLVGGLSVRALPASAEYAAQPDRKLVTTSALDLMVKDPSGVAEKVHQLALASGGYLVTSQINGFADTASASLTVRVPVASFENVRAEIRKLGLRVESDRTEAQDVTKTYVDQESRLHNLRAQEQQYLQILKRAVTVKDTLEVSDKLSEVRGQIEQQQAEFDALSKQVETVAISVTLRAEAEARVLGLNWKPLYRLKSAMREGIEGLGEYAASMAAFLFLLPTILLWMLTLLAGAAIAWRIFRWAARVFFHFPRPAKAVS